MVFTYDAVIGAADYFGAGHKVVLLIGLIVVVAVFGVLRIVFVRRRARRGRR